MVKFDTEGRVALVLGRKPETIGVRPRTAAGRPGGGGGGGPVAAGRRRGRQPPARRGHPRLVFNRPSDVAWDSAGNIYVADGMGTNNRVAKLDKDGRFIKHWGSTGTGPRRVPGREGHRHRRDRATSTSPTPATSAIQVFDGDGTFKREFGNVGTPLAMCMTRGATQYLYVSHAGDTDGMEDAAIYKVQLDGKVVGKFGAPASCRRSSASPTPSTAATRTSCWSAR